MAKTTLTREGETKAWRYQQFYSNIEWPKSSADSGSTDLKFFNPEVALAFTFNNKIVICWNSSNVFIAPHVKLSVDLEIPPTRLHERGKLLPNYNHNLMSNKVIKHRHILESFTNQSKIMNTLQPEYNTVIW